MSARVEWAIAGGALSLALAVVYSNAFTNSFHYDDFHSLVDNPHVRSWSNWSAFFRDPTTFSSMPERAMYRPMVLLSYAFNYYWGAYSTWGYHLVNTVVHLFNALAVYALVYVLGKGSRPALWAALLFALHPLCSEPVNYISSRSESLCALFYMASLLAYIQWRRNGRGWVLVSLVAFAAALLAKSVAAVLPAALLLYEIGFYKKLESRRAGFIVGAYGGVLALYIWVARRWLGDSLSEPVREYGIQWLTQIKALVYYAYLAVVPVHLSVEPAFIEAKGVGDGAVILAVATFLISCALCRLDTAPLITLFARAVERTGQRASHVLTHRLSLRWLGLVFFPAPLGSKWAHLGVCCSVGIRWTRPAAQHCVAR